MEFTIEARVFKQCIDAVVNLVDEGQFEFSKTGLHLRTMDPSQIAMIDFTMPKEAFEKFESDELTVGVNLVDFSKILSRARPDDKLTISFEEAESKFSLEFRGEGKRTFKMPVLDLGTSSPKEPKISFDSTVRIKGGYLKEMLKDAGLLSSHVVLSAKDDSFVVEAHGDSGDLNIEAKKGPSVAEIKSSGDSRAMFPFEYLDDISRACPDDELLEIHLKADAPVKVTYSINKSKLAYYLAPRVENA